MSVKHEIKIKQGYADGTLKLSDNGHTKADKKDLINWVIKKNKNVTSIENIQIKSGTDIFIVGPHANGDEWNAEINNDAPYNSEYEYSISWKGTWGPKTFDPKIYVKPPTIDFLKIMIMIITAIFSALFLTTFFMDKSKSDEFENE